MEEPFFESVLHPEDRKTALDGVAQHLESGNERWTMEYRVLAKDGRIVWVRDDAWIVRNAAGEATHVQGFMMDITAQHELLRPSSSARSSTSSRSSTSAPWPS